MKTKIIGILVCMLLVTTAIPVVGSQNIVYTHSKSKSISIDNNKIYNDKIGSFDRFDNTILYEDFEDDWVDDSNGDLAPEWWNMEQTSTETTGGNPCWWNQMEGVGYEDSKAAGLWWGFEYQNEWLITPSQDFSLYTDITLQFWTYNYGEVDPYWEGDLIKISTDGGENWNELANLYELAPPGGGFFGEVLEFDLSEYAGEDSVLLAFHRVTDDPNDCLGLWFIDDVEIYGIPIPNLEIGVRGTWFGIEITLLNDGEDFPGESVNVTVTVDAPLVLLGQKSDLPISIPDPGITEIARTGIVIGFGSATVSVEVEYMGDVISTADTTGFLFIVLVSFSPIPIP